MSNVASQTNLTESVISRSLTKKVINGNVLIQAIDVIPGDKVQTPAHRYNSDIRYYTVVSVRIDWFATKSPNYDGFAPSVRIGVIRDGMDACDMVCLPESELVAKV